MNLLGIIIIISTDTSHDITPYMDVIDCVCMIAYVIDCSYIIIVKYVNVLQSRGHVTCSKYMFPPRFVRIFRGTSKLLSPPPH